MKKVPVIILLSVVVFFCGCNSQEKETPAPPIAMKDFFKNGMKSSFQVSPDGQYYSYRADYKGKTNIFVQKAGDTTAVRVTSDTLRSIRIYFWKGDRIIYQQDVGGDENFQIFSVKADGTGAKALTPFPGVRSGVIDVLRFIPGKEKEMIVSINKRVKEYFDPYALNIETGELTLLYDNKQNFDSWFTDNNGVIRMASKTDGVNVTYLYRNSEKDSLQPFLSTSFKESFTPQFFDADNKYVYVLSNIGRDKVALATFDPVAKKELKEIYANQDYDLDDAFYDRKKKVLVSVTWDGEKQERHFFDSEWEKVQKGMESKMPGYEVAITSYDDSHNKYIVAVSSDRLPVKYFAYDSNKKDYQEVANPYAWLNEKDLAKMEPITFQSRDGLTIHGYLTLPKGIKPKNLPVVVNPHGGPWARDSWGYNPEVQFLANRGYAVLQLNFRGSTGYGRKFWESSFKQWGKKMQDDVSDGVEWLKIKGIADQNRIAIYGGSYGGYTTLAAVAFTPDLFAAAVDYVGVSNLFTFMNTIPAYWKPYLDQLHEMVGDPKKDSALLAEASPVFHADKIRTPLFIAQGANDPRVNKAESDQMVAALKKRGVEVEYMVKNNEGHGFLNQDSRFDFYGAMEKFLDKHLKKK
jgi:dipeptidyl aminopeptidase/acylaminoacyl peptidase